MIQDVQDITSFKWATVTATAPLAIKLDGDTAALALVPDSLVDPARLIVGTRVRVELSLRKCVIHGASTGGLAPVADLQRAFNSVRNARFRINQRLSASGASLALDQVFLDGWRSGTATNAVTWTGSDVAGRTLTIPASKTIYQNIEGRDVMDGAYLLIIDGTAQGQIVQGAVDSGMGASPRQATLVAGTDLVVRLGPGTVKSVMLVRGPLAPAIFPDTSYVEEMTRCQRYYVRITARAAGSPLLHGQMANGTASYLYYEFLNTLYKIPTFSWNGTVNYAISRPGSIAPTAVTAFSAPYLETNFCVVQADTSAGAGAITAILTSNSAGGYVEFAADF